MDTFIKDVKNFGEFKTWILKNIRQDTFLSYEGVRNIFHYMSVIEGQQSKEALDNLKKQMGTSSNSASSADNKDDTGITAYASSLNIDPIVFTGVLTGFCFSDDFPRWMTWEQLLNSPKAMTEIYEFFCDYWKNSEDDIVLWQNSKDCLGCPLFGICSNWYGDDERIDCLIKSMKILREEGYIALKSET